MKVKNLLNLDLEAEKYREAWGKTYPQVPMDCEFQPGKEGPMLHVRIRGAAAGQMGIGTVRGAVQDFQSKGRTEEHPIYTRKLEEVARFV